VRRPRERHGEECWIPLAKDEKASRRTYIFFCCRRQNVKKFFLMVGVMV